VRFQCLLTASLSDPLQVFFGELINSLGTYFDQPIILANKVNKVTGSDHVLLLKYLLTAGFLGDTISPRIRSFAAAAGTIHFDPLVRFVFLVSSN
jgi:hypothetical protein